MMWCMPWMWGMSPWWGWGFFFLVPLVVLIGLLGFFLGRYSNERR